MITPFSRGCSYTQWPLEVLLIEQDGFAGALHDSSRDLTSELAKITPSLRKPSVGGNILELGSRVPHPTHFRFHGRYSRETGGKVFLSILDVFRRCSNPGGDRRRLGGKHLTTSRRLT